VRAAGASPAFPANVFSLTLSERRKLGKGVRRAPAAYTMSGASYFPDSPLLTHACSLLWLKGCKVLYSAGHGLLTHDGSMLG
jgi:hypothetical protein